jgi:biotin carboxyl carrier protein
MKYNIKISEKNFEVEIVDINTRPIVVRVDGLEFEVSPGIGVLENEATGGEASFEQKPAVSAAQPRSSQSGLTLVAPLPGTVIEIFIKAGDTVESGQVIMIIEAMKMKNSIRSIRDGVVASIPVSAGQTVAHKQTLVEFTE